MTNTTPDPERFISLRTASVETGLTVEVLRARIKAGELPAMQQPGKKVWLRRRDLTSAIARWSTTEQG